ncbi:MAG: hypothetical protein ACUVX8_04390 [Candidatus Zipacnadales bacterium]
MIGCGLGCVTSLLLVVVAGFIIYSRMMLSPPHVAQPIPSPALILPNQPSPPPLEEQIEQARHATHAGALGNITLRLNEAQINEWIRNQTTAESALQNAHVAVGVSDLTLTGTINWRGHHVYLTIVGRPKVIGGRLGFDISTLRVGNFPLPGAVIAQIQQRMDRAATLEPVKDFEIENVSIVNGQLIITGHSLPR